MTNYNKEFPLEEVHSNNTLNVIKQRRESLESALNSMGSDNLKKLVDLRENAESNPTDLFMFIEMLHSQNLTFNYKDKIKQLEELTYLQEEPYFSRIDLLNPTNNNTDIIYIGKFGLSISNTDKPTITDWRAKIASVYYKYRYSQKNVEYETEDGLVTRDLKLKRTFEFDDGVLVKYYNNDIQLDESEFIQSKVNKRSGGVLEDIVSSIQQSQMSIIETDPRGVCIVQGCVGSGKSTVAIHKLSHMFFNYPKLIRPQNSLLIAKNQILVGYLSTLFPKLGIFDLNYGTLKDLIIRIFYAHEIKIGLNLDNEAGVGLDRMSFINSLRGEVEKIKEHVSRNLEKIELTPEYSSYFTFVYDSKVSIGENIQSLCQELEEEIKFETDKLKEGVSGSLELKYQQNIKTIKKILREVRSILHKTKSSTFPDLLKKLSINVNGPLDYKSAIIYTYIYSQLFGLQKFKKFDYCVVDEGQDFSLLEYLLLNDLVLRGRFMILGDLNQSYLSSGIEDWKEVYSVITDSKDSRKFELTVNYRSTKPIIDYARNIISEFTLENLPSSINRNGTPVVEASSYEQIQQMLQEDLKQVDKSIGIICFDKSRFEEVKLWLEDSYKELLKEKLVVLNPKDRIFFTPKGVYLTLFDNCKGLEFSKVYVLDMPINSKDPYQVKMNYVAVTRAMNELVVFYRK